MRLLIFGLANVVIVNFHVAPRTRTNTHLVRAVNKKQGELIYSFISGRLGCIPEGEREPNENELPQNGSSLECSGSYISTNF